MDCSHEKFRGLYMATLREELRRAGRAVDYIIVSHTEPDHSGAEPARPAGGSPMSNAHVRVMRSAGLPVSLMGSPSILPIA